MKKITFSIVLLLILNFSIGLSVYSQWVSINSGTTETLRAVIFTSSNVGYVAGDGGTILKTTNGGSTWSISTVGTGRDLADLQFLDANTGFCQGGGADDGEILKTSDAGANWTIITSYSGRVKQTYFVDANTGYIVGPNGRIEKTINGGTSWTAQTSGTSKELEDVRFIDANTGYVIGDSIILKTINGGISWQIVNNETRFFHTMHFWDANTGIVTWFDITGAGFAKTTDGGVTWQITSLNNSPAGMYFPSANIGYGVCYNGQIFKSTDAGMTWGLQTSGTATFLHSVYFTSDLQGFVVGEGGLILKTTDGGGVITSAINDLRASRNIFHRIFPNPFNYEATIEIPGYKISSNSNLNFEMYDCMGKQVKVIKNINPAGFQFNRGNLSNGIYFYQLSDEKEIIGRGKLLIE